MQFEPFHLPSAAVIPPAGDTLSWPQFSTLESFAGLIVNVSLPASVPKSLLMPFGTNVKFSGSPA
jgi:hypothetical protein